MTDRAPCPVCKSTSTLEGMARDALALAKQALPETYKHAQADIERGVVNHGPPPGPDQIEPLRTRVALIHQDLASIHHSIDSIETCAECGVCYRPELHRLKQRLEEFRAAIQARHVLDAMAREADKQ